MINGGAARSSVINSRSMFMNTQVIAIFRLHIALILLGCNMWAGAAKAVECDIRNASEAVLQGEIHLAKEKLSSCLNSLDGLPTANRDEEIQRVRMAGLAAALSQLMQDAKDGRATDEDLNVGALAVRAILDGNYPLAVKQMESALDQVWVRMGASLATMKNIKLSNDVAEIRDAFCGYSCCGGYEKLGLSGPHQSLVYIMSFARTSAKLSNMGYRGKTCIPKLNKDYLKLHGVSESDVDRVSIFGFHKIDEALLGLKRAPASSDIVIEVPIDLKGRTRRSNSRKWEVYKDANNSSYDAMMVHDAPRRYRALCLRLQIEAGTGLLEEWRIDEVAYISGGLLSREEYSKLIARNREKLKMLGVEIDEPSTLDNLLNRRWWLLF